MKVNEIKELVIGNSEVFLDQMLNDGLFKDIPVISNLVALYNVKTTISDKLFYNKIVKFYQSFSDVDRSSFIKWNKWATENIKQSQKITSSLVSYIDAQNEMLKCMLIGRLFKKLVEGIVTKEEFEYFLHVISMSSTSDLQKHCVNGGDISQSNEASLSQRLQFLGFYSFTSESLRHEEGLAYEITDQGIKFIDLMESFKWESDV